MANESKTNKTKMEQATKFFLLGDEDIVLSRDGEATDGGGYFADEDGVVYENLGGSVCNVGELTDFPEEYFLPWEEDPENIHGNWFQGEIVWDGPNWVFAEISEKKTAARDEKPERLETLRELRAASGKSLSWIAEKTGIPYSTLSKWNAGQRPISDAGFAKIAELLAELSPSQPREKPETKAGRYFAFHPGLNNLYWTEGETEDEAWEKMKSILENNHGGLASGMLGNVRVFRDQQEVIEEWIRKTRARGKAVRRGELHAFGTWRDTGIIPDGAEFPYSENGPYEIIRLAEDSIIYLDGRRNYVGKIQLDAVEPVQDEFGQTAEGPEEPPDCFYWYQDDQVDEGNFPHSLPWGLDLEDFTEAIEKTLPGILSEISDSGVTDGTGWSWTFYTFDPQRKDEFYAAAEEYFISLEEGEEENEMSNNQYETVYDEFGQAASFANAPDCSFWYIDCNLNEGHEFPLFKSPPNNFDLDGFLDWASEHYPGLLSSLGEDDEPGYPDTAWKYFTFDPKRYEDMKNAANEYAAILENEDEDA